VKPLRALKAYIMWWGITDRNEMVFQCLRPGVTPRSVAGECSERAAWDNRS